MLYTNLGVGLTIKTIFMIHPSTRWSTVLLTLLCLSFYACDAPAPTTDEVEEVPGHDQRPDKEQLGIGNKRDCLNIATGLGQRPTPSCSLGRRIRYSDLRDECVPYSGRYRNHG